MSRVAGRTTRGVRGAEAYLNSLVNFEQINGVQYNDRNFSLARMNKILAALGNPHKEFKSAHIVGTKGKGSTATMLSEMLRACGVRVGLYTSPHVLDIRERISVNGQLIPERQFNRIVPKVAAAAKKAGIESPTFFEAVTAAGFLYFAEQGVQLAVVEAGLGGRLDSTNVISPEVVGVARIGLDHMEQLGHTLPEIAREKAGVFKKGVPVISVAQRPEVRDVLLKVAAEKGTAVRFSDEDMEFSYRFEFSRVAGRHARICLTTPNSRFEHLHVPLLGEHQAANCGLALCMLDVLKARSGFPIDDQAAMTGLNNVRMVGRMELIRENPRILVDGAHNADSIDALMRAVGQHISYDSMIVIFGCQRDKDIPGMIRRIQVGADKVIFTGTGSPRSADPAELAAEYMERSGKMAQVARTLDQAMQIATSAITREDLICITGSFYLVGEAKRKYSGPIAELS